MTVRWVVAALHLLALGIGLGAIWARGRALRGTLDAPGLNRLFYADNWWGVAALLWLATGLFRAFGGLEKGTEYYVNNWLFLTKMGLFLLVVALEIWPMVTFIRWRIRLGRGVGISKRRGQTECLASLLTITISPQMGGQTPPYWIIPNLRPASPMTFIARSISAGS